MISPGAVPAPIFIRGLMARSGSHFLGNLLCLHPDCAKSALAEDALTTHAHVLADYAQKLLDHWAHATNGDSPAEADELFECLGGGLIEFLHRTRRRSMQVRAERFNQPPETGAEAKRLVTKYPWVTNLELFFRLFPQARLLVLVRNGPDTVESFVRSFAPTREFPEYEKAMQYWVKGARTILRVRDEARYQRQWMIIKYEDLHRQTELEMRRILTFLELETGRYAFDSLSNVPVVGSSDFKRGSGSVHWLPVCRTADFDPLSRAGNWTPELYSRFCEIAGAESAQLGYATVSV
ncbi:MAG TPA: sulfotransferase [Blastocatellia bacterium]|nr:sulfotransferase [Blastocatellia bacterium]